MSVTYKAMVAIGVRVMVQDILDGRHRRACGCRVDGEPNFCPHCGKPFSVEVGIDEIDAKLRDESTLGVHGKTYLSECDDVIIGDILCESYEGSSPKMVPSYTEAELNVLFQELQKHGFASDRSQIQTYSFLYVAG